MAIRDVTRGTIDLPFIGGVSVVTAGVIGVVALMVFTKTKKSSITKTITTKTNFRK